MSSCQIITSEPALKEAAKRFVVPKSENPQKIVVAMSGGVDSAAAAYLLKEAGHEVIGVSLRLAPEIEGGVKREGRCCSVDDMRDARQTCEALGIPFYAIDAKSRFKEAVFDPFVAAYREGFTPIPCLACNHEVKFGDLYKTAKSLGAKLATGHYAKVVDYKGQKAIARPRDQNRDQTYYLYGTTSEVIDCLELPLGDLEKPFVRAVCDEAGIQVSRKPDSQEICFVPDGDQAKLVEKVSGPLPTGNLVHIGGKIIAPHKGVHHFTIGQRRGIGIGLGKRAYVADIDAQTGDVVLGAKEDLLCTKIQVSELKFCVPLSSWPQNLKVQIRARHKAQSAQLLSWENGKMAIEFKEPVSAVALGQAAVVYDGDVLLGGGLISGRLDGAFPRVKK